MGEARIVVLIDSYERLAPLDGWVRSSVLPQLPMSAITVLAGPSAPSDAWRSDPAWGELLRIVSLRNLGPDETRAYLVASGVELLGMTPWPEPRMGTRWRFRCAPT